MNPAPHPDWLAVLRAEVDRTSQAAVAQRLGVSDTVISQVLSDKYQAGTGALELRVRGHLLREQLTCPVLGQVLQHVCLRIQQRPLGQVGGNPFQSEARKRCTASGRYAGEGNCPHYCGSAGRRVPTTNE